MERGSKGSEGGQRCQTFRPTGTPIENALSELWSIFDFLMPGFLGGYKHFKEKYGAAGDGKTG